VSAARCRRALADTPERSLAEAPEPSSSLKKGEKEEKGADLDADHTQDRQRATAVVKSVRDCVLESKRPRFPPVVPELEDTNYRQLENPVGKRDFAPK
jgi:hypothetical protein